MRTIIISFLIVVCPLSLRAQSLYNLSRVYHVSGAALDLGTTLRANSVTPEANPIIGQQPKRQIALEAGLTFAVDRLTHSIKDEHPRIATIINFSAGAVHFTAAGWNMGVILNGHASPRK